MHLTAILSSLCLTVYMNRKRVLLWLSALIVTTILVAVWWGTSARAEDVLKPGGTCSAGQLGTHGVDKKGQVYRCEQRANEDCPRWHWVYDSSVPRDQRKPPSAEPCLVCVSVSATVTPPVELPVTESGLNWWLVSSGVGLALAGVGMLRFASKHTDKGEH